jgi:integrase
MNEIIAINNNKHDLNRLDENPAAVYLKSLRPSGQRSMHGALAKMAEIFTGGAITNPLQFPWHLLKYQHVQTMKAALQELPEIKSPATVNKYIAAIKGVAREAWNLGIMATDDYMRIKLTKPIIGETIPAGRYVTSGEIMALLRQCQDEPGPAGVRDAAIIGILVTGGLRRDELIKLDLADFEINQGELFVTGKRGKNRIVPLANGALDALLDWLHIRGNEPGPLFWPINRGGRMQNKRLSSQAVYLMLKYRSDIAGVRELSPHDLRRTAASDLLVNNDALTVAKILGHQNLDVTMRYDRRGENAKRDAAKTLHIPYIRKYAGNE